MSNQKRNRKNGVTKSAAAEVETPKFESPEEANAALASAARVINMNEAKAEKDAKAAKAAAKVAPAVKTAKVEKTKDGRTKLPPLPRAKAKLKPLKPCECGCGGLCRARFVPGHDSRMRGWIMRVERDIVKLADIPDGERQAVARELKLRATKDGKTAAAGSDN